MSVAQASTVAEQYVDNTRIGGYRTRAGLSDVIMTVTRAIMVAVIALIILGALYATDIVSNPTNPNAFTNMTATFANYGTTAMTMIGLGLIALGASAALYYFGAFGGGGGR